MPSINTYKLCLFQHLSCVVFQGNGSHLRFVPPSEPLAQVLDSNRGRGKPMKRPNYRNSDEAGSPVNQEGNSTFYMQDEEYRISEGEGHSKEKKKPAFPNFAKLQ